MIGNIVIDKEQAMRKAVLGISAAALVLSLAACGGTDQPDNNLAAEDLNATTNLVVAPAEPTANAVVEDPTGEEEAPAAKPAPEKPAPAKPKAAEPRPAEPKAAEPKPADPNCAPEHRAAGHC